MNTDLLILKNNCTKCRCELNCWYIIRKNGYQSSNSWYIFSQVLRLQSALEESQLNEKQLRHKLEVQTETLNNKMEELRALNEHAQSSMTSEMMEVQMKIMELENTKVTRLLKPSASTADVFISPLIFIWLSAAAVPDLHVTSFPSSTRWNYTESADCFLSSRWSWSRHCKNLSIESSSWSWQRVTCSTAWSKSQRRKRSDRRRPSPGLMH